MAMPASYSGEPAEVRAEPKTLIAGGSSARAPKPSTNSEVIRSTRHGSVCSQSVGPVVSSRRWSVVLVPTWSRRTSTGPFCFSGQAFFFRGTPTCSGPCPYCFSSPVPVMTKPYARLPPFSGNGGRSVGQPEGGVRPLIGSAARGRGLSWSARRAAAPRRPRWRSASSAPPACAPGSGHRGRS